MKNHGWKAGRAAPMTSGSRGLLFLALLLLVASCGERRSSVRGSGERLPQTLRADAFRPYGPERSVVDSIPVDIDMDGIRELVLTSRNAAEPLSPGSARGFDRIEFFRLDTAKRAFASIFVDPVESGVSVTFEDVTRDGRVDVLVRSDAGGNNPIPSHGMSIYGYRTDGALSILYFSEGGDPALEDLDGDEVPEVLVTGEYWGALSHADAVAWTESIYRFDGTAFTHANASFLRFFTKRITASRNEYLRLRAARPKDPDAHAVALYRATALLVLWMESKGDLEGVRMFAEKETDHLSRALPVDLSDDLQALFEEILTGGSSDGDTSGAQQIS